MRVKASVVIDIMRGWVGLSRALGTHKPIIDTYNAHKPLARGYTVTYKDAYCDTTISAAFIKADAVDMIGGTECGVEEHIKLFKRAGIWEEDGTIPPEPGYLVCYNWDKNTQPNDGHADHVGIVETVNTSARSMVVIEGNMGGIVGRRSVGIGAGYIRGYAIPDYLPEASEGWTKSGGKWYYTDNGVQARSVWKLIEHSKGGKYWYYFGPDGAMLTGWQTIGGKRYFLEASGDYEGACWHQLSASGDLGRWKV